MPHRSIDPSIARGERRAAGLSLAVAVALLAIKFVAYALTGSSAVFSDALESIVNVLAGAFALYAIVLAHRPADETHPYGHGKVEFLAAGFEGGMILLAAMVIVWRGIESLVHGPAIQRIDVGVVLMLIATAVNGAVGFGLLRYGTKNGSITLEADGRHLLSDAVTTVMVLTGLLAVRATGLTWIDPVCALVVSVYLAVIGVRLLRRSAAGLMDEQDLKDDAVIRRILDEHVGRSSREPSICSYHKLRHRHTGRYHWVDFHMLVPAAWSVSQGHAAASVIEGEIEQALGIGDATAHVEPCGGCESCARNAPRD